MTKTTKGTTYQPKTYIPPVKAAPKAKTPEEIAQQKALQDFIQAQLVGRTMLLAGQSLTDEGVLEKEITEIVASNGLFKVTKKPIGLFIEKLQAFDKEINGFAPIEEGVQLLIPKIPGKYLIQILSWYRDVERRDHTEASNLFFWNHNNVDIPTKYVDGSDVKGVTVDGQLVIYTPVQTNSATLSEFGNDGMVDWFRQNMAILAEFHSHNTMDAFFSGTDNANENMTQFYGVWGRVTSEKPASIMRYVVGNTRKEVPLSYLFDIPVIKGTKSIETMTTVTLEGRIEGDAELIAGSIQEVAPTMTTKTEVEEINGDYNGPWPMLEYPDDWMGQHTKKTYAAYSGGRSSYYGGSYDYDYESQYPRGYWDPVLNRYVYPSDAAYDANKAHGTKAKKGEGKKSERQIGFFPDDDIDDIPGTVRNRGDRQKKDGSGIDEDDGAEPRYNNPILEFDLRFGDSSDDNEENREQIKLAFIQLSEDFVDCEIAGARNPDHPDY